MNNNSYKFTLPKGDDKYINIPIEIKWDFLGQEDAVEEYQQNVIEDILGETYQVDVRDTMPRKVDKSLFFQREILPSEAQYICFGKFPEASSQSFWNEGNCAGTFGLTYATYTVDLFDLPNVDGVFLLRPIK